MYRFLFLLFFLWGCGGLQAEKYQLNPAKAQIVGQAGIKGNVVTCNVSPEKAKGLNGAIFNIDLKPFRGQNIILKVFAKAKNLTRPPQRWLGTKFMLLYKTPDGKKHYNEKNGIYGSFSETLSFGHTVDGKADMGQIRFCVQGVSGEIQYDLDSFEIVKKFTKKNLDHICEYSEAVKKRQVRRGVMSPNRGQAEEENFKVLKDWNVNLMRLQLNTSENWARNNPDKYDKFINEKIEKVIPQVLQLGQKYGIKIIIDLHMVPGSSKMTKTSSGIYNSDKSVDKFIEIWKRIATKFKGHPALYGYDLMNEPKQTRKAKYDYWTLQKMAAEAIRKIDPETPIYVTSNMLSSQYTFSYLSPVKLKNIIYQVHCYDPFVYTHKKYTSQDRKNGRKFESYPGNFYGSKWNREALYGKLKQVRDFQKKHHAKIFVGEFSTRACAPGGDQLLADYISIFEELKWEWTYHCFREAKIWSLEYAGPSDDELVPSKNNPRKKVVLEYFKKN